MGVHSNKVRYVFLLAVQINPVLASLLPRPVPLNSHFGTFQQSRSLFTVSIETSRNLSQEVIELERVVRPEIILYAHVLPLG